MATLINPTPIVYNVTARRHGEDDLMEMDGASRVEALLKVQPSEIFDYIRDIKDPEHPYSLEQLRVVEPDKVWVDDQPDVCFIRIEFTPTVPHCSLASLIVLCLRWKLHTVMSKPFKLDIYVTPGKHATEQEINKQVNDKERVAAALENPSLRRIVRDCVGEQDW